MADIWHSADTIAKIANVPTAAFNKALSKSTEKICKTLATSVALFSSYGGNWGVLLMKAKPLAFRSHPFVPLVSFVRFL
jgi:hypothetical protein